jgi:sigma-B regulation protein RsbU (phosphoserine phosphatase)
VATETVLIVDDDDLIVEVMEAHLERAGYDTISVFSGEAAIDAVKKRPPDIILLDVTMRGMDGYETTKILKANPKTAKIPVLLVTGYHETRDIKQAIDAGVDDIIFKPVNTPLLMLRIKSLIRIKKLYDELHG